MMLVSDAASLYATLQRMHACNDSVAFRNADKTLKLVLRNVATDPESVTCELLVEADEDDEDLRRVLDLDCGMFWQERGEYFLDSWTFSAADFDVEQVRSVMNAINEAHAYRVCHCGRYLVKDHGLMCLFCQMTATEDGNKSEFCPICLETGFRMHMKSTRCCQQFLHGKCLDLWKDRHDPPTCPLCRHAMM